jgi:hypothetical protein
VKILFIISSSDTAFWLSEVTHPYWHLSERGVAVDFASPAGGRVVYDPYSDPYSAQSTEPDDLVSKGFLSDKALTARLDTTLKLGDVDLDAYDAVHVAGGRGATSTSIPTRKSPPPSSISGPRTRLSARSATAPSPWAISRSAFANAARPATRSKATRPCSVRSGRNS